MSTQRNLNSQFCQISYRGCQKQWFSGVFWCFRQVSSGFLLEPECLRFRVRPGTDIGSKRCQRVVKKGSESGQKGYKKGSVLALFWHGFGQFRACFRASVSKRVSEMGSRNGYQKGGLNSPVKGSNNPVKGSNYPVKG